MPVPCCIYRRFRLHCRHGSSRPVLRCTVHRCGVLVRCCHRMGRRHPNPANTPVRVSSHARFSSLVSGSGFSVKKFSQMPSASTSIIIVRDVHVDGVVAVCSADVLFKWQVEHLLMLTQIPDVCLIACQSGAVDSGLLTCADTDGLTVFDVADRVGLGVFQCNQA